MERYLIKYLFDSTDDNLKIRFLDYMKICLDQRLWSTGNQIPYNYDYQCQLRKWEEKHKNDIGILKRIKRRIYSYVKKRKSKNVVLDLNIYNTCKYSYKVLSLIENIPEDTIKQFNREGIEVCYINSLKSSYITINKLQQWYNELGHHSFNSLLEPIHYVELDDLFKLAVQEFRASDFDALLVRTSEMFYEKFFIDVFREIQKRSITLLHGLPGVYTKATESRSDFLIVYGNQIKKNFQKVGYDPQRILVGGNYKYTNIMNQTIASLRFGLEDILIFITSSYMEFQHEWEWTKFPVQDRSLLLTYLYSLQNVLQRCGVRHARLRSHPSVNKEWFLDYIDTSFYMLDFELLEDSLSKATLCIGQTSTTFLEAMMSGVTYLVYEPGNGKETMLNMPLVPPFDGSDNRLKVAFSESELEKMIKTSYKPDISILNDYIQPFDVTMIKDIIDNA